MSNIRISNIDNYYSRLLPNDLYQIYRICINNLVNDIYSFDVEYKDSDNLNEKVRLIYNAILYGCPELFFIKQDLKTSYNGKLVFTFENKYNRSVNDLNNELNAELDRYANIVNAKCNTDYDKICAINKYLCLRVKPSSSIEESRADAYGAVILKSARCEGYAKAAQLLMQRCNIESVIAIGDADNGNGLYPHAWIKAKCNNRYYNFDFTWNASKTIHNIPSLEYMFIDDRLINIDHYEKFKYPACNDESLKYWVLNDSILERRTDLKKLKIVPYNNNYFGIVKTNYEINDYEYTYEIFNWLRSYYNPDNYGTKFDYTYNIKLGLIVFYFLNKE